MGRVVAFVKYRFFEGSGERLDEVCTGHYSDIKLQ
jgi:hypothetical protein